MERYEGLVGTQQRQNMKKRARLKVEKLSNKISKSGPVDYWAAPQRACKTRPACAACVAQHARRRRSSEPNHCFVRHRDCATAAFEIVQIFARKRANAAANFVRFRCNAHAKLDRRALRNIDEVVQVSVESLLRLASRLHDCGVRISSKSCRFSWENARTPLGCVSLSTDG